MTAPSMGSLEWRMGVVASLGLRDLVQDWDDTIGALRIDEAAVQAENEALRQAEEWLKLVTARVEMESALAGRTAGDDGPKNAEERKAWATVALAKDAEHETVQATITAARERLAEAQVRASETGRRLGYCRGVSALREATMRFLAP